MKAQATRAGGKYLAIARGALKPKPPVKLCPPCAVGPHFDLWQFWGRRANRWREESAS